MRNIEDIEAYVTGKLDESSRQEFEAQLKVDSQLQTEVAIQQQIIAGIQKARMIELKSMLNNVPVGSGGSTGGNALLGKIAASLLVAGIIGTALYLNFKDDEQIAAPVSEATETSTQSAEVKDPASTAAPTSEATEEKNAEPVKEESSRRVASAPVQKKKTEVTPNKVTRPNLDVADPMEEMTETADNVPASTITPKAKKVQSSIEVETNPGDKRHNFHYQFTDGKLLLFGPFDKSLYEILEINGDGHAVFLFYQNQYFALDENQTDITPLKAITDKALTDKLTEYRKR